MNTATANSINHSSENFVSAASNHKPKALLLKHMQQYLEMHYQPLHGKMRILHELLSHISEHGFKLQLSSSMKEIDIIVALDKLSLTASLFFNLKVILFHNLKNMKGEIREELESLKLKLEILLLGMKQDQNGYIVTASLLNQLNHLLETNKVNLSEIHLLETKLEHIIESYTLDIFNGIQNLQEKGIKTRYLLSDI